MRAGLGQNQPGRADRLFLRPVEDQAMDRMAVELIGFLLAGLLTGVLKFTLQAIDLIPQRESLIDQLSRVGGHRLEIRIETGDGALPVSN